MTWLILVSAVAVAVLSWTLYRRFVSDGIESLTARRRQTSRLVTRGTYVDGNRELDVVLALAQSTLFYENADMQASLDLDWMREIEYDTTLATGATPARGKVLRMRSHSQSFEFVLPDDVVARWHMMLPPRRVFVSPAESATPLVVRPAGAA